jgi:hypothetical protein
MNGEGAHDSQGACDRIHHRLLLTQHEHRVGIWHGQCGRRVGITGDNELYGPIVATVSGRKKLPAVGSVIAGHGRH